MTSGLFHPTRNTAFPTDTFRHMLGLIRDWLLDPAALLFLTSAALVLFVSVGYGQRARLHEPRKRLPASHRPIKAGFFANRKWAVVAVALWLLFYAFSTAPVVVNPLVVALEQPYGLHEDCSPGSHLVVLGGGVDSRVRSEQDFYRMRPATFVRATEAATIALADPGLRVIVAGGALKQVPEADVIAHYLLTLGVLESQLLLESRSSNTRENALNVLGLLSQEKVTGPIRLVTSALHMRRALGTFQQVFSDSGLTFCPVSTDIQGLLNPQAYAWMPQTTSLVKFDLWLHEIIALTVYRLRGWI